MNVPSLIDLSGVVAVLASLGVVSALLQWLRDIALDGLTARLADAQRNAILRALLVILNFGAVLALALLTGSQMSAALLVSAALAAFPAAGGSHVLYSYVQKSRVSDPAGFNAPADPTTPDGAPGAA